MNLEIFKPSLSQIHNEKIREMTTAILSDAPAFLEVIPAASSGKYHPELAQGNGGLIRHIFHTLKFATFFFNAYGWKDDDVKGDMVISALLLHDICKKDKYIGAQYLYHPINASDLMEKYKHLCDEKHFKIIQGAVKNHMGIFTPESHRKPISDYNLIELIVYNSDYLASRKEKEFFG